jgi:hypothetical protein
MNSAGSLAARSRGRDSVSYNQTIMTGQRTRQWEHRQSDLCPCQGYALRQSRLALSEVQIFGIPKLSLGEVAPTP